MIDSHPANTPNDEAGLKQQRKRSIAIALALGAFVLLFYAATMVKMSATMNQTAPTAATKTP